MLPGLKIHVLMECSDGRPWSVSDHFVAGPDGEIIRQGLLRPEDLPTCEWLELQGLQAGQDQPAAPLMAAEATRRMVGAALGAVGPGGAVLWVCGHRHARMMQRIARGNGWAVTVLRGSLREGNPYRPLADSIAASGSKDEHILRLSLATYPREIASSEPRP